MAKLEKKLLLRSSLIGLALSLPSIASARTIWVQTTDIRWAGNGSYNNPYHSIEQASYHAFPGDNIYLKEGVHYPTKEEAIYQRSGSQGAPITIQSEPNKWAILDFSRTGQNTNGIVVARDYYNIQWLQVRNSRSNGILLGTNNCRVEGTIVHDCFRSGIEYSLGSNGVITGNTVYRTSKNNEFQPGNVVWAGAVKSHQTYNIKILNNTVYENWGEGIDLFLVDKGLVSGNYVRDTYSINIYFDNVKRCEARNNTSTSYWDSRFLRNSLPAVGIGMANESTQNPRLNNNKIINNVIDTARIGIYYGDYFTNLGMKNTDIRNNTVRQCVDAIIQIDAGNNNGSQVRNNTFYKDWSQTIIVNDVSYTGNTEL